jgi:hypothetical protein
MVPLSRSVFWGPMAIALMGGLLIATALTLLFLPALYAAWFRVARPGDRPAMGVELPFALPPIGLPSQQPVTQQVLMTGPRPLHPGASP